MAYGGVQQFVVNGIKFEADELQKGSRNHICCRFARKQLIELNQMGLEEEDGRLFDD